MSGQRYVPIVAVVPQEVSDLLYEWASDKDFTETLTPLVDTMQRNGWTASAMLAGVVLRDALRCEVAVRR